MELYALDTSFNKLAIVDSYESVIWVDRYNAPGEIELYLPANKSYLEYLVAGNYLVHRNSEHVMVIEGVRIETNIEEGNHFTVTGRSIESFLDRRIVWQQTDFGNVYLQTAIKRLLNENVINPTVADRAISNFIFEESTDSAVTSLKITSAQYTGDNLLDVIRDLCETFKIGFKVTLNSSNQFVFKLYAGTDRSYDQSDNTYVVFSPDFDNIINSNYYESDVEYKNVTLVAGQGEGIGVVDEHTLDVKDSNTGRLTFVVGSASDLDRRELFTDARDISTTDEDGNEISIADYNEKLKQRGEEKLSETTKTKTFDGKVDSSQMFVFGEDFFIGDIVQLRNEYGIEGAARVTEYIMSENIENGLEYYPTFEAIQEDTEE